ncbi:MULTISPECIES: cell envelope biogenesis protein TolA [unclassified Variovorax]|uniref:cell envelope biogenesis protein TolA n=1 Tax=unclassified Variovorax TaxID=663243 RepID=UPI000D12A7E4|nr:MULTISPECIES: cell envelope biogenesis protein TolA [unclassified Variovorax]AVQ85002.1 cell envelope biogenesis protein TolA [Variovorax sp. PMC12]QRY34618.1 cell envelope biogenesis protein TolA [Variovorax sp. PDNC026]
MKAFYTLAAFALAATAGLAHAQAGGDASSTRSPILDSKPQLRAEAKKDARTPGKVKAVGGDELKTAEDDSIGSDKSAKSGQTRVASREARHPDRKPAQQGGTPDLPGAK